ncbi:hypothetical protein GOV06_05365 [Candidatus Woesearchaeota archaeon]|nr:hypothetical protein [Candidatus Woesearchaeota archaeon]
MKQKILSITSIFLFLIVLFASSVAAVDSADLTASDTTVETTVTLVATAVEITSTLDSLIFYRDDAEIETIDCNHRHSCVYTRTEIETNATTHEYKFKAIGDDQSEKWSSAVDITFTGFVYEQPEWSNANATPATPAIYDPLQEYTFTVDWELSDWYPDVEYVFFESNITGSLANESTTRNYHTYTYTITGLDVGNYLWRMHASDEQNNTNVTDDFTYTVIPADPVIALTLNGAAADLTVVRPATVLAEAEIVTGEAASMNLYQNTTLLGPVQENIQYPITFNESGYFEVILEYTGTSNYNPFNVSLFVNVTDNAAPGPITNVTSNVTDYSITWNWLPPADDDLNHTTVTLYDDATNTTVSTQTANATATSVIFTGLNHNSTYTASFQTFDLAGNTDTANIVNHTATTLYDSFPPLWSNAIASPVSPIDYDVSQAYQFNVTWTDPRLDIVWVEHNFTGVPQNITVTTNSSNEYYYNYSVLGAGNYFWRMFANDTLGNVNSTDIFSYIVNKAASVVNLLLNTVGSDLTVTYPDTVNASFTSNSGLAVMYRNGTDVTSENNLDVILGAGYYNYTVAVPDNQNTTATSQTLFVTVLQNTSSCTLTFTPSTGLDDYTPINASCVCTNPEATETLYRGGIDVTGAENNQYTTLSAGNHSYICNVTATQNYTTATDSATISVALAPRLTGDIQINEFMADSSTENDWVELYNNDSVAINITNWEINDTGSATAAATLTGLLNPGEFIQVYVSNRLDNGGGESIELINTTGGVIDTYAVGAGVPQTDVSIGRYPEGTSNWYDQEYPTPNATNIGPDSVAPVINSVSDTPDPLNEGQNITITANVTDNIGVGTVLVEIEGTNYTMVAGTGDLWNYDFNTTGLATGLHSYTIYADDVYATPAVSQGGSFTILDTTAPVINSNTALPAPVERGTDITITANVTDDVLVNSVLVEVAGVNYTMVAGTGDLWNYNVPTGALSTGANGYTIYADDSSANPATPAVGSFNVQDTAAPSINSSSPTGTVSPGTITIQLTTNEIAVCRYNTTDEAWENMTQMPITNAMSHSLDQTLSDGNYNYYFLCEDSIPNRMNSSHHLQFSVSTPASPPSSSCFPAGTKILMEGNTEKNIEDVEVGDIVIGFDGNKNIPVKVLELESPIRDHLYTLTFEDESTLQLTEEHPLYTRNGWKSISPEATAKENAQLDVGEIKIGDEVLNSEGKFIEIIDMSYEEKSVQTYNLKSVSEYNNFFANGFLAHNKGGSSGSNTYYIDLTKEGESVILARNDRAVFDFKDEQYEARNTEIRSGAVTLRVGTTTAVFSLGDELEFDLDSDGENDISIILNGLGTKATVLIKLAGEEAPEIITTTAPSEPKEPSKPKTLARVFKEEVKEEISAVGGASMFLSKIQSALNSFYIRYVMIGIIILLIVLALLSSKMEKAGAVVAKVSSKVKGVNIKEKASKIKKAVKKKIKKK